jgi:hypothetical protein
MSDVMTSSHASRFTMALASGSGYFTACAVVAGIIVLGLSAYDPQLGQPISAFTLVVALSIPLAASAACGTLLGTLIARRIARVHVARAHWASAIAGAVAFALVQGLIALQAVFDDSLIRPNQTEKIVVALAMPLLAACLSWWLIIKVMAARKWLLVASKTGKQCDACGYDLRGIRANRCPECGKPVTSRKMLA